ncbi:hypothetical protein L345_16106, partial [Ophiophagus hannah]
VLPFSRCNDPCFPGFWKKRIEGEQFCCYDCVACPEGKISDQNDLHMKCTKFQVKKSPVEHILGLRFFHSLYVMTLVSMDPGRKGLRGISSAAMTVFHARKGRFQIKMVLQGSPELIEPNFLTSDCHLLLHSSSGSTLVLDDRP